MKTLFKSAAWVMLGATLGAGGATALKELAPVPPPDRASLVQSPPPEEPPPRPEIPDPPPALPEPASPALPSLPPPAERVSPSPPPAEFFGFAVGTLERAPDPPPPPAPAPPIEPKSVPAPPGRYLLLKDKCVAGFDGTSTIHDFRGWTRAVTGEVRFEKDRIESTASASIVVDARTLDTGNPDRDKEMHEDHLQSAKHPEMKFALAEFRRGEGTAFTMKGALEIHGRLREVEIPGTLALRSDGVLHAKGEFQAKMSDFGIQPPTAALIIRTADDIRIWFEIWARHAGAAP